MAIFRREVPVVIACDAEQLERLTEQVHKLIKDLDAACERAQTTVNNLNAARKELDRSSARLISAKRGPVSR